jgi:hypothetical protein
MAVNTRRRPKPVGPMEPAAGGHWQLDGHIKKKMAAAQTARQRPGTSKKFNLKFKVQVQALNRGPGGGFQKVQGSSLLCPRPSLAAAEPPAKPCSVLRAA